MAARYFGVSVGGGRIMVPAANYKEAKAVADKLCSDGCNAEYCLDIAGCLKAHYWITDEGGHSDYHDTSCNCEECLNDKFWKEE